MTIFDFDKETDFFFVSFWSRVVVAGRFVSVLERCSWKRVPEIEGKHSPAFLAACPLPLPFPPLARISPFVSRIENEIVGPVGRAVDETAMSPSHGNRTLVLGRAGNNPINLNSI